MDQRTMQRGTGAVSSGLLALMLFSAHMTAIADPLDQGEAYTTRPGPPDWMANALQTSNSYPRWILPRHTSWQWRFGYIFQR